jgi:Amt family ammonium transporter
MYSALISLIAIPFRHWIWGGGWLAEMAFTILPTTAGHMLGGVAGFGGAKILGREIGKYSRTANRRPYPVTA